MLARFGRSEYLVDAEMVVRACVVAPGGVRDAAPLAALAERVVAGAPQNGRYLTSLGAALYRAGRLEEAAAWMEEARQRKSWENPLPWDQRLILQRLRREAEALVDRAGPR